MTKSKRIDIKIISLIIFLVALLLPIKCYSIQNNKNIDQEVIVGGELLHINIKTEKLMFYVEDDSRFKLKKYDLITCVQGNAVKKAFNKEFINNATRKDILTLNMNMKYDENIKLKIIRNNKVKTLCLSKYDINPSYFTEEVPFSGSLTYINPKNNTFGALGHNMKVPNIPDILSKKGNIYLCKLQQIKKSNLNEVGNMYGEKICGVQGNILNINDFGLRGKIVGNEIFKNSSIYKLGDKDDISLGAAQVLIKDDKDSEKKSYDIEITKINEQNKADICGFEFKVTDKNLIENYGGIVQGMSGCPVIQNGKLIGALSHVCNDDTKQGMGVYINWMIGK
ncbi:SpoIVB peptidase S55 domain-containing protein [Faecalimicrobium dakarense]|uniref:SpoIVB peptidase S55 domain-containing protein n=1 Tax=Faecalimicrobium dakarense TaxID=1301100 RepID=UPI0004AF6FE4|nr:SpoIVB peptidase S55 domain-containing protein [[Clostridium] dakarense]